MTETQWGVRWIHRSEEFDSWYASKEQAEQHLARLLRDGHKCELACRERIVPQDDYAADLGVPILSFPDHAVLFGARQALGGAPVVLGRDWVREARRRERLGLWDDREKLLSEFPDVFLVMKGEA